nr:NAD(P)-binding domain-containing protein [Actinokineospora enzanensis]
MRIGILGTGMVATALGSAWARAGHEVVVGGRSPEKARALAAEWGARAATPREVAVESDAVLLAVLWDGVDDMLRLAGAAEGTLSGKPLMDATNAVDHGIGVLHRANAEHVAETAIGAQVVKAFHLYPAEQWNGDTSGVVVPLSGDDEGALAVVSGLVRDTGAEPWHFGKLDSARQLEEVAGFVIRLFFAGADPRAAIPGRSRRG